MTKELKEHIMVGEAINEWQGHYLTEVRNLSGNAIRAYRNGLGLFLDYLESVKGVRRETLVGDCFRVDTIEDWLAWMKEAKGCSPSTCNLRLASLRSFIAFLARKNVAFIKYGCSITSVKRLRPAKKTSGSNIEGNNKSLICINGYRFYDGQERFCLVQCHVQYCNTCG
ncbi:site-specific integrase [Bacteroides fragilis]